MVGEVGGDDQEGEREAVQEAAQGMVVEVVLGTLQAQLLVGAQHAGRGRGSSEDHRVRVWR